MFFILTASGDGEEKKNPEKHFVPFTRLSRNGINESATAFVDSHLKSKYWRMKKTNFSFKLHLMFLVMEIVPYSVIISHSERTYVWLHDRSSFHMIVNLFFHYISFTFIFSTVHTRVCMRIIVRNVKYRVKHMWSYELKKRLYDCMYGPGFCSQIG